MSAETSRVGVQQEYCIAPRVQAGGGGLRVWAGFHAGGKTDPVFLVETLNQLYLYSDILEQTLLPFARTTLQDNCIFQDDKTRPHLARIFQDSFQNNGIEHMEWPSPSPDMTPFENLWAELTRQIDNSNQTTLVAELRQALINSWKAFLGQTLQNLVDSMHRQVRALLHTSRGHTKYWSLQRTYSSANELIRHD